MKQYHAKGFSITRTHLKVSKIIDGDGFMVKNLFNNKEEEIRLLGIDAPEIKICKKLVQDERETHMPGELLIHLGRLSHKHLINALPINSKITLIIEADKQVDLYGRTLAYAFTDEELCLNEIMLSDGFAKPYNRFNCFMQYEYQILFSRAKLDNKGLFKLVTTF